LFLPSPNNLSRNPVGESEGQHRRLGTIDYLTVTDRTPDLIPPLTPIASLRFYAG